MIPFDESLSVNKFITRKNEMDRREHSFMENSKIGSNILVSQNPLLYEEGKGLFK